MLALVVCIVAAFSSTASAQRRAPRANPVMAGDYPDPSVIRVGRDYWATATTSEWAPEFPLLHSRDLVHWRTVGAVFQKRPAWSVGSYWAPEISQYRGRFYIYYVARKKDGPLCVAVATSNNPAGPYRDHGTLVCQEVGSIDGFPVDDENGQRYLLWKEDGNSVSKPTPIWAQRLSPDGTRLIGERKEIMRNDQAWEKHATLPYGDLVEGPAIVRRNGWFYMFYSGNFCCARECNYAVGVARSRKLLGPWEKNPANPILAANEAWKCPGHGTVVTDERGRDYFLYHAYHPKDFVYVGRQGMLDEIRWNADGWPTINDGRGPGGTLTTARNSWRGLEHAFFDDFNSARLQPVWQWPQANEPTVRIDPMRQGWLTLAPASAQADSPIAAVLARPTTRGDYTATTMVDARGLAAGALAGLSAYGDAENAIGASVGAGGRVQVWRREKNEQRTLANVDLASASSVYLRMTAREGHRYRFAASRDGRRWMDAGEEIDGSYLPPWDRGVRVALTAGGAPGASGRFGFLRVEPLR
jgi:beta-xylosidase